MKKKVTALLALSLFLLVSVCFIENSEAGTSLGKILRAGGKAASRIYRKSAVGEGALTQEMLESCIVLNHEIKTEKAKANKLKKQIDNLAQEIDGIKKYVDENKNKIDQTHSAAVDAFNAKINTYRSKHKEHGALVKKFNAFVDPYTKMKAKYTEECQDQSYYKDDYEKAVTKLGYGM